MVLAGVDAFCFRAALKNPDLEIVAVNDLKVVISAPAPDPDITIVSGVNDADCNPSFHRLFLMHPLRQIAWRRFQK